MKRIIVIIVLLGLFSLVYCDDEVSVLGVGEVGADSIETVATIVEEVDDLALDTNDAILDFGTMAVGGTASIIRTEGSRLETSEAEGFSINGVDIYAEDSSDNSESTSTHQVSYDSARIFVRGQWQGDNAKDIPGVPGETTASRVHMNFTEEVILTNEKGDTVTVLLDSW